MCQYEKYISPLTDFGFKKIFGDPDDTILLQSLIDDILGFEGEDKIKTITFKNGELLPDSPEDRKAIFDLYCEDEKGSNFIVELQKVYQEHFQSRALYYTSFPIQEQATRGTWNFELTPIYFIGLLNFEVNRFRDNPSYIHHGKITDITSKDIMYDQLNMIYIELPKLKKTKEELFSHLDWWVYILHNLHKMKDIPAKLQGDVIENAFNKANFLKLPKDEQLQYHQNLKVYRDLVNSYDTASKDGFDKGMEKGIEQGLEQGAKKEKFEIAKNLLSQNIEIDIIMLSTGLRADEIEQLAKT